MIRKFDSLDDSVYKLAEKIIARKHSEHIHLSKAETEAMAECIIKWVPGGVIAEPGATMSDDPHDQISTANTRQVGGEHYGLSKFQHWDMVDLFQLDYFQGQITKYVMRWRKKNGLPDLQKAQHFLEKYIELESVRSNG